MANKFKKNDTVKIITGKDKGKVSKILKFFPKLNKALVSGVNIVKKHTKPSKLNPKGGIEQREMTIHTSNIMHVDPDTNSVSKIGFRLLKDGGKVRYLKKSNGIIDNKKV